MGTFNSKSFSRRLCLFMTYSMPKSNQKVRSSLTHLSYSLSSYPGNSSPFCYCRLDSLIVHFETYSPVPQSPCQMQPWEAALLLQYPGKGRPYPLVRLHTQCFLDNLRPHNLSHLNQMDRKVFNLKHSHSTRKIRALFAQDRNNRTYES